MSGQWDNFLRNLGEWRGTFTSLSAQGEIGESTASLLSLSQDPQEQIGRAHV